MNIQLRLTPEMKATPIEYLNYSNKSYHLLKRLDCATIEDVAKKWDKLGGFKGVGAKTVKEIHNGIVNYMLNKLSDDDLVEWFKYLIDNNTAEDVKAILDGFNAKEEVA